MTKTTNGILSGADRVDHVEPVGARHLDVEEHQVGVERHDRLGAGRAVAGLADDLEARLLLQQRSEPLARERLVVDHQDSGLRCAHVHVRSQATRKAAVGPPAAVTRWKGISIRTESPPCLSENSRR